MTKYQKYAEYKDSGVDWLGDIPSHWGVKRLGSFFEERREKVSDVDYPALSVTKSGIVPQLDTAAKTDAGDNRKLVKADDFVINSRSDRKGSSGISPYTGSVSLISIVMEPRTIYPAYAHHLLRSYPFQEEFYRYGKGIVADLWSTNSSEMKNILLPVIPITEQQNIANFLDHETAKIDSLIEKQQQLIQLLKEKRQAVISHAVTKGLNPNVSMKDSGVEWLGEVPEHWGVSRLKNIICSLESGCSVNAADIPAQSYELGVLKTSCVYTRSFRIEENKTVVPEDIHRVKCKIRKGAIVISRMNTPELVGASALVKVEADNIYLPDRLWQTRFFQNIEIDAEYLSHFMTVQGFRDQIALGAEGASSSMQNIAKEDYLNINCLVPPLKEQIEIRDFIERKLAILSELNMKAQEAVECLKERRTALISAAVTGKIDVRNWQNPTEAKMEFSA